MKIAFVFLISVIFSSALSAQSLSGIKTIDAAGSGVNNYLTLKDALDSLNLNGVGPGGVVFNVASGFTETAPTGGFVLTATGTSADPIVFQKSGAGINPLLTAQTGGTGTPATAVQDVIFKIVGSDYVTIDGIDLQENGANTTTALMEAGYGIYKASLSNGAQNVTIKNCVITLSRSNVTGGSGPMVDGSVGIALMNATPAASITALVPTARVGTNSYNKFYSNTIQNCNVGIALIGYAASSPFLAADTLNDVGGSSALTGNTIINYGGGAGATTASAGIRTLAQYGLNISYNTINNNNGSGVNHVSTLRSIFINTATSANATISYNTITIKGGSTTSQVAAIENVAGSTAANNNTIAITHNTISAEYITATTGNLYGIFSSSSPSNLNITNNTISSMTYSTNALSGSGVVYAIYNSGAATNARALNNTVSNITRFGTSGGTTAGIYTSSGTNQILKLNTVGPISIDGTGTSSAIMGLYTTTGNIVVDSNTVQNLSVLKTTGTGAVYGIYNFSSPTNENYNYNTVTNLSAAGAAIVGGIYVNTAVGLRTISNNLVHTLSANGAAVYGIRSALSSPNIFRNKTYNLTANGAAGTVFGISIESGNTINVYNNLVGDLKAPAASAANAIVGLNVISTTTTSAINAHHNTIYLNASSSGTNFGTSGIFHTASATATTAALTLRNNIVVNASTPAGTGLAVAYRRSSTNLGNYTAASNNNLFYAGTPGTANLIFYDGTNSDQTVADFKTRMATRDQRSFSENPTWVSTTPADPNYLNIATNVVTQIESGSTIVSGITTDFGGNIRSGNPGYPTQLNGGGSLPDVGAWEFDGLPAAPTVSGISVSPGTQCVASPHTISANVVANQGTVSSVSINYAYNGVAQTPVSMTNTTGNTYTGVIPAATPSSAQVSFSIIATNSSSLSAAINGPSYFDEPLSSAVTTITASSNPLCLGDSVILTADAASSSATLGTGTVRNATTGTTSGAYPAPFGNYYQGAVHQMLVPASELSAAGLRAGNITSLAFDVFTVSLASLSDFTIKIGTTSLSAMGASFVPQSGLQTVYSTTVYTPSSTAGYATNKIIFNTPFVWDGVSNIIVQTCFANTGFLTNAVFNQTTTPYVSTLVYREDATTVCNSPGAITYSYSQRPNMKFEVSTFSSYSWSDGISTIGNTRSIKVSPAALTNYTITATDPNNCSVTSAPFALNVSNTNLGGTYTVGVGGNYATLTEAIAAYNTVCFFTAPVVFSLIDANYQTAETFPIVINSHPKASASNSLTIKPAPGVAPVIHGKNANAIIHLKGSDYVTIDGSNSGTNSRELTIANDTTTGTVVWITNSSLTDGATHNTIKNTIISGVSPSTTIGGILSGSYSALGDEPTFPNHFNTIENNLFNRVQNAMYLRGNAVTFDRNWVITGNTLGSSVSADKLGFRGMLIGNARNFTISNNTIAGVISTTGSSSAMTGIQLAFAVDTGYISGNKISDIKHINTTGYGAYGILLAQSGLTANVVVNNNFIYDITGQGNAAIAQNGLGIVVSTGGGYKIYHNTINLASEQVAAVGITAPILIANTITKGNSLDIRNNIFSNGQSLGNRYSFYNAAPDSVFTALDYNSFSTLGTNLAFVNGANRIDFAALKAAIPGKNINSKPETPVFVSATDLHIPSGTLSYLESGGILIPGYTTDIDGDVRPGPAGSLNGGGTAPDIGADEFDGMPNLGDITPPVIVLDSIAPAGNACIPMAHTVYATITDASGIDTAEIRYSVSGVAQSPVIMTHGAGDVYTGVIPVQLPGANVVWSLWAKDAGANNMIATLPGGTYRDAAFAIQVTANPMIINNGDSLLLSAKTISNSTSLTKTIGTGTSTSETSTSPFYTWFGGNKKQYLFRASELIAGGITAGVIQGIDFDVILGSLAPSSMTDFTIHMDSTNNNVLTATHLVSNNLVYGPTTRTASAGINNFEFANNFIWNGTSNIYITICWSNNNAGAAQGTSAFVRSGSVGFSSNNYNHIDNKSLTAICDTLAGSGPGSTRPNIGFHLPVQAGVLWTQTTGGGLTSTTIATPKAIPANGPGQYTYKAIGNNGSCTFADSVTVTVVTPVIPMADFTASNLTPIVGNNPTTVTFNDQSSNIPGSWRWSFSPNTVTYVNGTSATTRSTQVQFTSAGLYTVKLVVSNPAGSDSVTKVSYIDAGVSYCTPANTSVGACIDSVLFAGIANGTTTCAVPLYTQQPSTSVVYKAVQNPFTVRTSASAAVAVWIDYNRNGIFEASEYTPVMTSGTTATVNIKVPISAKSGLTGMRVRSRTAGNALGSGDACSSLTLGETEDYMIDLVTLPGDWYPPDFGATYTVTPPGGGCTNVAHTVSIDITDTTGVDSAWIAWSVGGVTQPNVLMTKGVGSLYSGVIPPATPGASVLFSFIAKDSSPNANVGTKSGGSYVDAVFNVKAITAQDSIGLGASVQLDALLPSPLKTIGVGNSAGSLAASPFYGNWGGNKKQYLFRASELMTANIGAGASINGITFDVETPAITGNYIGFSVFFDSTQNSATTTAYMPSVNQVFGPTTYSPVFGVNTLNFSNPFVWNGTSNIYITICWGNNNSGSNGILYVKSTAISFNGTTYSHVDGESQPYLCGLTSGGTTSTVRPDIGFSVPFNVSIGWTQSAGGGLSSTNIPNPIATPLALGTYTYKITADNGTCTFSDSVKVKVINVFAPVAKFTTSATMGIANATIFQLSDTSLNIPTSWKWSFSPNTVTYVGGTDSASKNPRVTFNAGGMYSVKLVVTNNSGSDSLVKTAYIQVLSAYCVTSLHSGATPCITNVNINTLSSNTTSAGCALPAYTLQPGTTTLLKATPYPFTVITNGSAIVSVWIDYNQNGTFEASEWYRVYTSGTTATININVPISARNGLTMMRVRSRGTGNDNGATDACTSFGGGETEDYIINIQTPPGDYYAPDFANKTITPPGGDCNPVAHVLTVNVTDTTGVDSVWVDWSVDGVLQTPLVMTHVGSLYSATIPARGTSNVEYSFRARDISVNKNEGTFAGGSYRDAALKAKLNAGADAYIPVGGSHQLNASIPFNVTVGSGNNTSSSSTSPFYTWYGGNKKQYIFRAAELVSAGLPTGPLTALSLDAILGTGTPAMAAFSLYIDSTTANQTTATFLPHTTQVFGPVSYTPVSGTNTFPFSAPFVWNGRSNIMVTICWSNNTSGNGQASNAFVRSGPAGFSATTSRNIDGVSASDACGITTDILTGTSTDRPIILFSYPAPSLSYSWSQPSNGGLSATNIPNPVATPTGGLGAYQYIITANDGTCSALDTVIVNVVAAPVVNIGGPTGSICGTTARILDAGNPGATYAWRKKPSNTIIATTRTYAATTAGEYKVTVTNQANLSSSDSITLTTAPAFTVSLGPDRGLCTGGTITLDAGSHTGYLWSTGATTQTIPVSAPGTYSVMVTNSIGCAAYDTIVITNVAPTTVDLGPDLVICGSSPAVLDAGNPGSTYLWSTGATTQTISAGLSGSYSVIVHTPTGCTLMDTINITNLPAPTVNLGPDQSICPGSSVVLDAGSAGTAYLWSTGATTQTITVSAAGTYHVTVTGANQCSTKDTVVVSLKAVPVVNLGSAQEICTSDTITLDAGNAGSTYLWSTGATTQTIRVSLAATYSVTVTSTEGCSGTGSVVITNKTVPNAAFTSTATDPERGQRMQFNVTNVAPGQTYQWNFGDPTSSANTSALPNPVHIYTAPGSYTVSLTVTNLSTGCVSRETITITVTGIGNEYAKVFKLTAAPNPFAGSTKVTYNLEQNAKVSLEVYDMIGRKVSTLVSSEDQAEGKYTYDFNNDDTQAANGMYMIRLIVDGNAAVIRVIDLSKK